MNLVESGFHDTPPSQVYVTFHHACEIARKAQLIHISTSGSDPEKLNLWIK